jgi:hypothetical protein
MSALLVLVCTVPSAYAEVTFRWVVEQKPHVVEIAGFTPDEWATVRRRLSEANGWLAVAAIYVEPAVTVAAQKPALPPMAGTWKMEGNALRFEPQFPLVHGVRYRAEFRSESAPVVSYFELPVRKPARATEVVQIYPSADVLPENQLKFYVQFSGPMSRGGTYEHVHVCDGEGRQIDLPFLDLDEELWDPSMTRLTLLIDPGRIKRGVKPLEDIGPVFEHGKSYTLTLDASCRDAAGNPLGAKFQKSFRIGDADRMPPDPRRWKITPPTSGSRDAVVVTFDEPMDHALAQRLIEVEMISGRARVIAGDVTLGPEEREWKLVPTERWAPGKYALRVVTHIEDLAGNNIGKTFDVDVATGAARRLAATTVRVEFEIK